MIPLSEPLLRTHPRDLSAGTKLALAIAMQLSYKPEILLIDEPVKGLDPIAREKTAEVLACVAETGCAVIFATHDEHFARSANTQIRISGVLV
jgi:energy-coupling factor transport system ATP-binding protein